MNKTKFLAARLRSRLTFLEPKYSPDDFGGYKTEYKTKVVLWGMLSPLYDLRKFAGEVVENHHLISQEFYVSTIRTNEDIHDRMKLQFKDKIYEIIRIIKYQDNSGFMDILVKGEN